MDKPNPMEILWSELHSEYGRLVGLARSLGGGSDAEDIVSSVLLRVATRRGAAQTSRAYLAKAVRNETIDRFRERNRHLKVSARTFERPVVSVEDEAIAAAEADRWAGVVFRGQTDTTAAMIRLRVDGASWREIANQFREPIPTVQARVRRAFLRARRLMEAEKKFA